MSDLEKIWNEARQQVFRHQAALTSIMDQLRAEAMEVMLSNEFLMEEIGDRMFEMMESPDPIESRIGKFALMGYCSSVENCEPPECPEAPEADDA